MAGPGDLWSWLQSLGPGPGNVGPVNGFLPDPTQTPPNPRGDGPPDVMSPAAMYAAQNGQPAPASPAPAPFVQPQHPGTMRYPMWPSSMGWPMAAPEPAAMPTPSRPAMTPTGPLATPSGQGGIGSDYAASARNMPLKRRAGAANLGYYAPTTGNAQRPNPMQYTDPNDPRIFRG